jgi:putative transcriptional regulator
MTSSRHQSSCIGHQALIISHHSSETTPFRPTAISKIGVGLAAGTSENPRLSLDPGRLGCLDMNSLKGHLLIATPQLHSPIFSRSVILMLDHSEEGAMGVILNNPLNVNVTELSGKVFEEEFEWDKPLFLGGPVTGPLMVLHTIEEMADQEVIPGVFCTLEATKVQEVISRKVEPSLIVANYSGWGPGQLEGEFDWDSWLTLPAQVEHVFWDGDKDLWKVVVNEVNARKLSEFLKLGELPADPSMN